VTAEPGGRPAARLRGHQVVGAVLRGGAAALSHAWRQLAGLHQITLDRDLLDRAATLAATARLRSLDAVHLAAAPLLGADVEAVVTDDQRMTEAATGLGLPVDAPH